MNSSIEVIYGFDSLVKMRYKNLIMEPELPAIYKRHYPFRLACPSFIYPAGYVDNVRKLCGIVDEIELLLLESAPADLPRADDIRELSSLAADNHLTFNVHLPTDIPLAAGQAGAADPAVEAVLRAVDLSRPLAPVSYTLHVPLTESPAHGGGAPPGWQARVRKSLERLLTASGLPAEAIAVETLDYPLDYLAPVIREMGLSVCLDTGHLMVREESCRACFKTWQDRIVIIHTHGVAQGRDHLPLDRLSAAQSLEIADILTGFRQSVSLEVFSLTALAASLIYLDTLWHHSSQLKND